MKKLLIGIFVMLISGSGYGQIVSESIIGLSKKYNPLFSKEAALLSIEYFRQYEVGVPDTTFFMIVQVNNVSLESESISVGASIFGSSLFGGGSVNSGTSYKINKDEGVMIFTKEQLIEFYDCGNSVYSFIGLRAKQKEPLTTLCWCKVNEIVLGAELESVSIYDNKTNFYFKVGDKAVFTMTQDQFVEIMTTMRSIKEDWALK